MNAGIKVNARLWFFVLLLFSPSSLFAQSLVTPSKTEDLKEKTPSFNKFQALEGFEYYVNPELPTEFVVLPDFAELDPTANRHGAIVQRASAGGILSFSVRWPSLDLRDRVSAAERRLNRMRRNPARNIFRFPRFSKAILIMEAHHAHAQGLFTNPDIAILPFEDSMSVTLGETSTFEFGLSQLGVDVFSKNLAYSSFLDSIVKLKVCYTLAEPGLMSADRPTCLSVARSPH